MILYFGNMLSAHGNNPSFIESLGPRLATLTPVKLASDKNNMFARLIDMAYTFFRFQKRTTFILVDTYSYKGFYFALMIAFLSKIYGKKYIPIIHGGDFKRRFRMTPRLTRYLLRSAHLIVAPSVYMKQLLVDEGYSPEYIPNFIDVGNYTFLKRSVIRPSILWVRSFHRIYNPLLALELLQVLLKTYPLARLCMVGPDKDGTGLACRQFSEQFGLQEQVEFTGKLSKADWIRLSRDYDIFINTTTIDNHPVSVIEAMLLGLAVVSSNVGGIPFLVEDKREGLLAESGNVHSFEKAITLLLQNNGIAEDLQLNARRKAESFDWTLIKNKWITLLALHP